MCWSVLFFSRIVTLAVGSYLHSKIIDFVSDPAEPAWHGYFYAVLMVIVSLLISVFAGQYFLLMMTLGMRMRAVLTLAVYKKVSSRRLGAVRTLQLRGTRCFV